MSSMTCQAFGNSNNQSSTYVLPTIKKVKRDLECLSYQNDNYQVHHVRNYDYTCDLHIIVDRQTDQSDQSKSPSSNNSKQILIPVDKKLAIKNLKYFESMFKDGSNWVESKKNGSSENEEGEIHETGTNNAISTTLNLRVASTNPKMISQYLKSLYSEKLELTNDNCIQYYEICDFLGDTRFLTLIDEYIQKNMNFNNVFQLVQLFGLSDISIISGEGESDFIPLDPELHLHKFEKVSASNSLQLL